MDMDTGKISQPRTRLADRRYPSRTTARNNMAALGAAVLSVLARAQTNTNVPKWTPTYNMSESTVCADPLLPHPTDSSGALQPD